MRLRHVAAVVVLAVPLGLALPAEGTPRPPELLTHTGLYDV